MTMNDDASFWIVLAFIGIGAIGAAFEVVRSMRGSSVGTWYVAMFGNDRRAARDMCIGRDIDREARREVLRVLQSASAVRRALARWCRWWAPRPSPQPGPSRHFNGAPGLAAIRRRVDAAPVGELGRNHARSLEAGAHSTVVAFKGRRPVKGIPA